MPALALILLLQTAADLERHVRALASDEMRGRDNDTDEGRRAAAYVADRFREAGLKPGGSEGFFHDFKARVGDREVVGRNVAGLLEGADSRGIVVVAAHHDARGVIGGRVQNGADDNASGVAMVIELARAMSRTRPARSVLFVSFDAEEDGLLGSREFVKWGRYEVSAAFVLDLVGGDPFPWEKDRLYALGSESSLAIQERLARIAGETKDLEVARGGIFLIEPFPGSARSDYHAFRQREAPFVFFSTGTPWYYHTEHDDADRLNYGKMARAAKVLHRVVAETASDPARPEFRRVGPSAEDAALVREGLNRVVERRGEIRIAEAQVEAARKLSAEIASAPEAALLQRGMILLLTVARAQGERR